jgi:hypothetical protein
LHDSPQGHLGSLDIGRADGELFDLRGKILPLADADDPGDLARLGIVSAEHVLVDLARNECASGKLQGFGIEVVEVDDQATMNLGEEIGLISLGRKRSISRSGRQRAVKFGT